jgi:hypothetical protein
MPDAKTAGCEAEQASLLCMLDDGHDGLHYDDIDDISWKPGKPDA